MYINDVVLQVRRVLPGEYTTEEIYRWCDELSADLRLNYCKKYGRCRIAGINGCYYLPEGITDEYICSVIAGNKEIPKRDMRTLGFYHEYTSDGNMIVSVENTASSEITLNYIVPYTPIRLVNKTVDITGLAAGDGVKRFSLSEALDIKSGDVLNLKKEDSEISVSVLEMYYENDMQVIGYSGSDAASEGETVSCKIERSVTEKTECEPPYDSMYVDFCTMKIAWYQRNYSVYGYIKKSFSDKLAAYEKYLRRNACTEEVTKIVNYMI